MPKSVSKQSASWRAAHFKRVVDYINDSRNVLAMICIEKDNVPLEQYKHYDFLIDVIDHALRTGKSLLEDKDTTALNVLGGKKALETLLDHLEDIRDKDVHAGDADLTTGHWDNLTPEQLAAEIEKVAKKTKDADDEN